ncbi:MAG: hypothetical protein JSW39_19365, partial [Desulfobacterales bacterium]
GIIAEKSVVHEGEPLMEERYFESLIGALSIGAPAVEAESGRVLNISEMRTRFLKRLADD